jgi:hypothetical protein
VATTIERIDLGCARNPMRVLIKLTAPLRQFKGRFLTIFLQESQ